MDGEAEACGVAEFLTLTTLGKFIATFFISMVPVVELRGGLPYGIALGLPYPLALTAAVPGNMVPMLFIIVYLRRFFKWLGSHNPKSDRLAGILDQKV